MIKATDRKLVVGLEIGTAKVAALVGEVLPDGMVNIIGVGSCPSRGMDKGGVNDLESVVKCVQRAIDQAELMADCQISSVYLALSGKHISCQNEIGMVPISEEEVTQEDVENVVHTAKSVRVRDEHRVLHVIPQEYANYRLSGRDQESGAAFGRADAGKSAPDHMPQRYGEKHRQSG